MAENNEKFSEYLDELEREESGGGGIICQATFQLGYKTFIPGLGNTATFFSANTKAEKEEAVKAARAQIRVSGADGRPQMSYAFILKRDTVLGREVGWKENRWFVYPVWTAAAKQIIRPALAELNIYGAPVEFWGRFVWTEDPSGRKEQDQYGEERTALIAFPAERYASQEEAVAAAGGKAVVATTGEKTWDEVASWLPDAVAAWMEEGLSVAVMADAQHADLPVKLIVKAMATLEGMA